MADDYSNLKPPDKMLEYLDHAEAFQGEKYMKLPKKYLSKNRVTGMYMPEDE